MKLSLIALSCFGLLQPLSAGLSPGEQIQVVIRGVPADEQAKINGNYRVGDRGGVRLPMLGEPVSAKGLTPEQFARQAEAAYRNAGIYRRPAIEVETIQGGDQKAAVVVSVGGQVRKAGETPFRKDLTVIQAIDAAGGRNDFGGRNVMLIRQGRQYCLDFDKLSHKSIRLKPGDSLQVEQKGVLDRWKGSEVQIKELGE